jgi:hypothetical protein
MRRHPNATESRLLDLLCDALATYRLTTLVKDDRITEPLRDAVFGRWGDPADPDCGKPSYLLSCPWCLSVYIGAAVVAARVARPREWGLASKVLALSAATGLAATARSGVERDA